ncbi:MAG TPA: hypothetical protein VFW14_09705, partial [Gaiellales bacterium]|nr:hypothetical protein [Gaiellales bacterium]
LMLVAGVAASGVDVERLFVYVYAMDYRLAVRHEEAITAALGPSGRMIAREEPRQKGEQLGTPGQPGLSVPVRGLG